MRALQVRASGRGLAGVALVEVPDPVVGANDVLVAATSVSANHLDRAVMAGAGLARSVTLPRTLGIDPVGVVVAQGAAVRTDLVGQRVVVKPNVFCGRCRYCVAGNEADCDSQWVLGVHRDGGAADRVAVPARAVIALPDALTDHTASAAVHSVPVALHLIRAGGGLEAGATVIVLGAAGAVGSALVQLAHADGAHVIGCVRGTERQAQASELGADVVISTDEDELAERLRAAAPHPADVVYDTTGDPALLSAAVAGLGWRGRVVTCAAQGAAVLPVDLGELYRRRLRLIGAAAADLRDVRDGLDLVAAGRIRVPEACRFPLDGYREAYALLADRTRIGKVVFEVTAQ